MHTLGHFLAAVLAATLVTPAVSAERRHLFVAGQSLASPWATAPVQDAFRAEREAMGDTTTWTISVGAVGNSAALKDNAASIDRWWIDNDGNIGPSLTFSVEQMKRSLVPTEILWIQGQSDATAFARAGVSPNVFKARYKHAVIRIIRHLRAGVGAKVPVYIQTVGQRRNGEIMGDRLIREAQLELISEEWALDFRLGAVQPMSLPLKDYVHPTEDGSIEMAKRNARAIRF